MLSLIVFLPLLGAVLLLLIGNRDGSKDGLVRNVALGVSLVTFAATLALWAGFYAGHRRLPVRRTLLVDPGVRHRVLPRRRRHQPDARRPHRLPDAARAAVVLGQHRAQGQRVLDLHAPARNGHAGRVPLARPVPVLRVLGRDADSDVFPHRHLGLRPARLRGGEVPALHDGRQRPDAGRHHRARRDAQAGDRRLQLRPAEALRAADRRRHADLAVPRLRAGLRDQGAAVPAAHVAARRARAGADRGLGDSGRRAAEDGHLRPGALRVPAVPGSGRDVRAVSSRRSPSSASSTARWSRWCSRT